MLRLPLAADEWPAPVETTRWDPADHVRTIDDVAAYLDAAFEDGDPAIIPTMLGTVARSKGVSAAGRDALVKALDEHGDPRLSALLTALRVPGPLMTVKAA